MKIALNYIYLTHSHSGGKDQVGLNLLKGFTKNKTTHNKVVICFDYAVNVIKESAPEIKIISIKSPSLKNELSRLLYICFVNSFIVPKLIKKHNIDLIYHLNCNNGLRKLKSLSIVIPHDIKAVAHRKISYLKISYYKYLLYKVMYRLDFFHADGIIAISDCDKNDILKFYPEYKEKIKRIYNPIFIKEYSNIPDKMINEKYMVAINLQFHHKNIITLIKAYEKLKDRLNYKLVLVGSLPDRVHYLKEYVRNNDLEEDAIFTGFVNEEDMYSYLVNASLYINPTLFEGFGMTAIEAMILQIPTLISKIPTNFEVTKGLCNYYEPADSVSKLKNAISECLLKKEDQDYLRKCSDIMKSEYLYDRISLKYDDYFNQIVKENYFNQIVKENTGGK